MFFRNQGRNACEGHDSRRKTCIGGLLQVLDALALFAKVVQPVCRCAARLVSLVCSIGVGWLQRWYRVFLGGLARLGGRGDTYSALRQRWAAGRAIEELGIVVDRLEG